LPQRKVKLGAARQHQRSWAGLRLADGRTRTSAVSRRRRPSFCCPFRPHREERAQGRPGAGWHPGSARGKRTRGDHRWCRDIPAFPAQWFYGLWRALPGERCTIAPVALRL